LQAAPPDHQPDADEREADGECIVEQQPDAGRSDNDYEDRFEHALRGHQRHLPTRRPG
jgi:hypothetical protein